MSAADILILALLGFGAYRGFRKGFLLEIVALLAFVMAIIGGFKLLHLGMNFLEEHFAINGNLLPYVAFILIFILTIVVINLLGKVLKKVLDFTPFGIVDNIAGALLSVLKWAFGISILLWLTTSFGLDIPERFTEDSQLFPYVLPFAPQTMEYFSSVVPFAHELFDMIKEMLQNDPSA